MLDRLIEYAERKGIKAESGFAPKAARWAIVLEQEGGLPTVMEIGDVTAKRNPGREFARAPDLSFGDLIAGGVTKSHFLIDTADVVALHTQTPDDEKLLAKHAYFIERLRDAAEVMPELGLAADALADPDTLTRVRNSLAEQRAKPTDKVTFRVGGSYAAESEAWHNWWRAFRAGLVIDRGKKEQMLCFATGEIAEPAATHKKIKGLADVGGLAMGAPLIGFDKEAFTSYGLKQSANCAMSEEAVQTYVAALTQIIARHSQRLAGAKVAHWFRKPVPTEDSPAHWLMNPTEDDDETEALQAQDRARRLLTSVKEGERPDLAGNEYYALTLSGAAGRVMVRDWMEGPFEELVANVGAWFDDLTICHRDGHGAANAPKFYAVLGATVRDLDDLAPPFVAKLWRVALRNEPIPRAALAQALLRCRAAIIDDDPPNHACMGLIKAYHLRNHRKRGEDDMPDLKPDVNEEHPSAAYQCGRLMAVMARLQRAALGDVGAGVVQRYYAAASSTPALVLGRLVRTSQHHLNKLEGGLPHWFEDQLAAIWTRLGDSVPATLTLEEQSLFALGYYQQIAHMRAPKSDTTDSEAEASEGEDSNV